MARETKPGKRRSIAVDLDGTLAHYEHFEGPAKIGAPIPEMVEKVKQALDQGDEVTIFTARVNANSGNYKDALDATIAYVAIADWCTSVFGHILPITHEKSREFTDFWDDRAEGVVKNTGVFKTELMEALGADRAGELTAPAREN